MNVGIILQARMNSTRLPGKILKPFAGRPMLGHILERLQSARSVDQLILATTTSPADQEVLEFVRRDHPRVKTFAGSEQDVLDRYVQCARGFKVDLVVRCTGDNPLVDIPMLDALVEYHRSSRADVVHSKTDRGNDLPVGAGAEVYSLSTLERSWREGTEPENREHVDGYIHQHPELFRILTLSIPRDRRCPDLRLTVDTPGDFQRMSRIYEALHHPGRLIDLPEVIRWCRDQGWAPRE